MRQIVQPYGFNVSQTARHLKVTRAAMSNLLNGKAALSADMAVRFEKAFGISASTMLNMQAQYDLAQTQKAAKSIDIKRVPMPA